MPDSASILMMAKSDEVPTLATTKPTLALIMLSRLKEISNQWDLDLNYLKSNVPNKEFCQVSNIVLSVRRVHVTYTNSRGGASSTNIYECEIYRTDPEGTRIYSEVLGTLEALTVGKIIFAIKRNASPDHMFEYFLVMRALCAEDWIRSDI